jgi:hypothetical protein
MPWGKNDFIALALILAILITAGIVTLYAVYHLGSGPISWKFVKPHYEFMRIWFLK